MIIAQLSDTHITPERTRADGRRSRQESMARAIEHVLALPAPADLVLVTGDLTDHGAEDEYDAFQERLKALPMPVYVVPGNHDDRMRMLERWPEQGSQAMPGFMQYVVETPSLRLLALDTVRPGSDAGELCRDRLAWLEARLSEAPETPTLVFMHHPPFKTGLDVLDALGLSGAEALGAVVSRHRQVERIVAGHIHCEMQQRFHGTLAMTATSTALQIKIDRGVPDRLWATPERPTCLVHAWSAATGLLSHSSAVGDEGPFTLIHDSHDWVS